MGDVNAKIGVTNEQCKGTTGTGEAGVINENGELFVEFCVMNDLGVI